MSTRTAQKSNPSDCPFFDGIPESFLLPSFDINPYFPALPVGPTGNSLPIVICFGTEEAPYFTYDDVTQRDVAIFFYDPSVMNLRRVTATISRSINPSNQFSAAHVRLLRSDNLQVIAQLDINSSELQTIETTTLFNIPTTPVQLDVVVFVDNPSTNIQLHSVSFYV